MIRKAEKKDCKAMMDLIHELAIFEKAGDEVVLRDVWTDKAGVHRPVRPLHSILSYYGIYGFSSISAADFFELARSTGARDIVMRPGAREDVLDWLEGKLD